ncbi:hypothetical protein ANACOL_00864 [Anaerotruncus colihominis DSM 17241]|uniref:Uncharacterized protein n=1 Tax=Anaerotruncus colihominis DSM 17241 TaxID=445972 RepID=B0P7X6_9FIRM|nr:hypothetical protein ANACOL_00864 [Anaerotruncus colihominis DSM 17241]
MPIMNLPGVTVVRDASPPAASLPAAWEAAGAAGDAAEGALLDEEPELHPAASIMAAARAHTNNFFIFSFSPVLCFCVQSKLPVKICFLKQEHRTAPNFC